MAEREAERNFALSSELDRLQGAVNSWVAEATSVGAASPSKGDLAVRLGAFLASFRTHLRALGHAGVAGDEIGDVRLDETYTPYLGGRRLRSLGSASDHARLVMAFALALADASASIAGNHPGFLVFDEPLQQNPDETHRSLFLGFLEQLASAPLPYSVLVFTSLLDEEVERLRRAGVCVDTPSGTHFLKVDAAVDTAG